MQRFGPCCSKVSPNTFLGFLMKEVIRVEKKIRSGMWYSRDDDFWYIEVSEEPSSCFFRAKETASRDDCFQLIVCLPYSPIAGNPFPRIASELLTNHGVEYVLRYWRRRLHLKRLRFVSQSRDTRTFNRLELGKHGTSVRAEFILCGSDFSHKVLLRFQQLQITDKIFLVTLLAYR
jgi:hypothetical protein